MYEIAKTLLFLLFWKGGWARSHLSKIIQIITSSLSSYNCIYRARFLFACIHCKRISMWVVRKNSISPRASITATLVDAFPSTLRACVYAFVRTCILHSSTVCVCVWVTAQWLCVCWCSTCAYACVCARGTRHSAGAVQCGTRASAQTGSHVYCTNTWTNIDWDHNLANAAEWAATHTHTNTHTCNCVNVQQCALHWNMHCMLYLDNISVLFGFEVILLSVLESTSYLVYVQKY